MSDFDSEVHVATEHDESDDLFTRIVKARARVQGYVTIRELVMIKEAVFSGALDGDTQSVGVPDDDS